MPDEPVKPPPQPSRPVQIAAWSRYGLGAVGGAASVFGTLAVFKTELEAGPVALLILGAAFLLLALTGVLPTRLKVGENEAEWRDSEIGNTLAVLVDDASDGHNEEVAQQINDIARIAPTVAAAPLAVIEYESMVRRLITKAVEEASGGALFFRTGTYSANRANPGSNLSGYRIDGHHSLRVEIRATSVHFEWFMTFLAGMDQVPNERTLLVIRGRLPNAMKREVQTRPGLAVVAVQSEDDYPNLVHAVARLIRIDTSSERSNSGPSITTAE